MPRATKSSYQLRTRIYARDCTFGVGKAQLLAHIEATGSLSAAARQMKMSYTRAWKLVQEMNRVPDGPMVEMTRGGPQKGGALLTPLGGEVLRLYQEMDRAGTAAARPYALRLARLLE